MLIAAAFVAVVAIALLRVLLRDAKPTLDATLLPQTGASIQQLLASGNKIEAIKLYRRIHKVDLKDAKDAVERLATSTS